MTVSSIAPTASQQASAALHLERRADWRTVRIDGTRYVVLPSGRSTHVYQVRGDAAGCSCPWYLRTGRRCSHMLALELAEAQPVPASKARPSYDALYPACRTAGCNDVADSKDGYCDRCASDREWLARRDAAGRAS